MDCYTTLASPVEHVFAHLASPARLSDWLPEVMPGPADPDQPGGLGVAFPLTMRPAATEVAGSGEVTAFEPPWLVGYRLSAGPRTVWLRASCTAYDGGTRIHLHQSGDAPLAVDLGGLQRALATGSTGDITGFDQLPDRTRSRHAVPAEETPPVPRRLAP